MHRSPPRRVEVHSLLELIPSRVPRDLLTVRPVGRIRLPEVPRPFNDILELARCETGCQPRLGSALRFAPPLSGFLAGSRSAAFFRAARRSWASSPSESLLQGSAHPSRGRLLPCGHPPTCRDAPPEALSPPVSPTPARAVAWIPGRLWAPFPRARSGLREPRLASAIRVALPGPPGPRAAEPPRSAGFTRFEAFFLPASPGVPARVAPVGDASSSPGVSPL